MVIRGILVMVVGIAFSLVPAPQAWACNPGENYHPAHQICQPSPPAYTRPGYGWPPLNGSQGGLPPLHGSQSGLPPLNGSCGGLPPVAGSHSGCGPGYPGSGGYPRR
jgi:hypothetical protein